MDAVRVAEAARRLADAKADGNDTPFLAALTVPALDQAVRRAWELRNGKIRDCGATMAVAEWYRLLDEIRAARPRK